MKKFEEPYGILVMASGGATDSQVVIKKIEEGEWNAKIVAMICDKPDAYAMTRARDHGIPAIYIGLKGKTDTDRIDFNKEITKAIEKYKPKLILLLGWMKLLGKEFIKKHEDKTWNVHPAPLPMKEGGMDRNVHKEILERAAKFTGATLMFIDEGADTGPIIDEIIVAVKFDDTIDTLRDRVQKAEQDLLEKYIPLFMQGRLEIVTNAYGGKWVRVIDKP